MALVYLCCLLLVLRDRKITEFLLSGYINSSYSKTGYWFSILSVVLATLIMSLINIEVSQNRFLTSGSPQSPIIPVSD